MTASWRSLGIEIDDELEVTWRTGSARNEKRVWVLFTHLDGTPFVTADREILKMEPMPFYFGGAVWPLLDGDAVTSVRRGGGRS